MWEEGWPTRSRPNMLPENCSKTSVRAPEGTLTHESRGTELIYRFTEAKIKRRAVPLKSLKTRKAGTNPRCLDLPEGGKKGKGAAGKLAFMV